MAKTKTAEAADQIAHRDDRLAYSVDEAARLIGVSRSFLYMEMQAGKLAFVKAGKRRIITRSGAVAYLASLERAGAAA